MPETEEIFGEGSVETGDPISIIVFTVMVLIMVDWLSTASITPLPTYAFNTPLLNVLTPSFNWILIALIPITTMLIIQWALQGNSAIAPSDRLTNYVFVAREKVKSRTSTMQEKRKAYKLRKSFKNRTPSQEDNIN